MRRIFFHNMKNNLKEFLQHIMNKKSIKDTIGPGSDDCGTLTNDSKEIVPLLNKYFDSVFKTSFFFSIIPRAHYILPGTEIEKLDRHNV